MKSQSFKLFAIAFVLGLAAIFGTASSASAQSKLIFETSFDFHVGKEKLAAGKYEMVKMNYGKYLLRNVETRQASLLVFDMATGESNQKEAENVVFNRYGETYFLRSIFDKRGAVGKEMVESKYERQIRRSLDEKENQLADKKKRPAQVTINLSK